LITSSSFSIVSAMPNGFSFSKISTSSSNDRVLALSTSSIAFTLLASHVGVYGGTIIIVVLCTSTLSTAIATANACATGVLGALTTTDFSASLKSHLNTNPLLLTNGAAMPLRRYPFKLTLSARTRTMHIDSTGSSVRRAQLDVTPSSSSDSALCAPPPGDASAGAGGAWMRMYIGGATLTIRSCAGAAWAWVAKTDSASAVRAGRMVLPAMSTRRMLSPRLV
jgi:hypothetical protein